MRRRWALATSALAALTLVVTPTAAAATPAHVDFDPRVDVVEPGPRFNVLVYSRTTEFRHLSIPIGVETIKQLGKRHGFGVAATEDPEAFRARHLRNLDAVIFLNTTGRVLGPREKRIFRRYIRSGGGYVGIHSASDTEHDWRFYGALVGAHFLAHPLQQLAWFANEAPDHPAMSHIDERFLVFDEFYSFTRNPRRGVRVLMSIDESTYFPDPNTSHLLEDEPVTGVMGDHPMAWCHDRLGGRAFYTALGHEPHMYLLPWFRRHLLGGILVAAREIRADCSAPARR